MKSLDTAATNLINLWLKADRLMIAANHAFHAKSIARTEAEYALNAYFDAIDKAMIDPKDYPNKMCPRCGRLRMNCTCRALA